MTVCMTCGTDSDDAFTVTWEGRTAAFDCIECLATMVAPICAHCGCRILGHSLVVDGGRYCCPHCAQATRTGDRPRSPLTVGRWRFGNTDGNSSG